MTLQEQANKEGVTRQAIWARGKKGKAYRKTDKYKAYQKNYYLLITKIKKQQKI